MNLQWRGLGTALWLALSLSLPLAAVAAGRHVSIIVDTSGSMDRNDKPRYTLLLSQILADLLEPGDSLTVIRLPQSEGSCDDGENPALAVPLNSTDRNSFQAKLDRLLYYGNENYFAAPVHTAQADLERHKDKARLLLFIADSGGLDKCEVKLTEDLKKLRDQGVMVAAINIGGVGAFDSNPAFTFTTGASDSEELTKSVALVYQKFIGARQVQTGRVGKTIEFELGPLVKDAYLVVVADGQMEALAGDGGNPEAAEIDLDHKGGGHALGLDGRRRDYRIVRIHHPEAGKWQFHAPELRQNAGWMLLQDSAMALRLVSPAKAAQGVNTPLEVELYDQDTGKRLNTPPEGLQASVELEGQKLALRDDGQGGDRLANDGVYTTLADFKQVGPQRIGLNLQSALLDRRSHVDMLVEKVGWILQADALGSVEVDTPVSLHAQARPTPPGQTSVSLEAVEAFYDGTVLTRLGDDGGNGDKQAGDHRYTGLWTPQKTGDYSLELRPVGGGSTQPITVPVKVVRSLRFGDANLALRLLPPAKKPLQGAKATLEVELYDQDTGKHLDNPPDGGLQASLDAEGRTLTLRDDGQGGDRLANDGVFAVTTSFARAGIQQLRMNLKGKLLDSHNEADVEVEETGWALKADPPGSVEVESPASLSVRAQPSIAGLTPPQLQAVEATLGGNAEASLRDDGKNGDAKAGDLRFTGLWTPQKTGDYTLEFKPLGGGSTQPVTVPVKVVRSLHFGDAKLALRLASSAKVAQGVDTPLEVELYDQDTGKHLANPPKERLQAGVEVEGQKIELRDDGKNADRKPGDGVFAALARFSQAGSQRIKMNLQGKQLDRQSEAEIEVEKVGWTLQADAPSRVEMDTPATLGIQAQANPSVLSPVPLQAVEVYVDGKVQASLRDDGKNGDAQAGDNRYSGQWTPQAIGERNLEFRPVGGSRAQPVAATVKVVGSIRFGAPVPVKLGRTGSNSQLQGRLELGAGTVVKGEFTLDLNSAYHASGSSLEIDLGEGWVALDGHARPVSLNSKGPSSWPLRLRVGDCPAGVTAADRFTIEFAGADANGQPVRHSVPIELAITEDPWLHCWWPVLAAAAAALLTGIVIYGFWSPSRFSAKLGVLLSPEEDMNEGFFHPIRAQRGTGSGFYRDARVYVRPDFRLSASAKGELARLRADGRRVFIRPATAATVYRQNFDGAWEALPTEETTVHFGVVYKDSMGGVYFELRNG